MQVAVHPRRAASLADNPLTGIKQFLRRTDWNLQASYALTLTVIFAAFFAGTAPFRARAPWLLFLQDDCFYYLKIAEHLAAGHGSTFNGINVTNGYHPLWLLTLTLFRVIFPATPFIVFIAAAVIASTIATYFLARAILQRTLASPLVVNAFAACVAAFSMLLLYTGMEIILTIPLVLFVIHLCERANLRRHSARHAFALGLLFSALVLSRIDSALLAILLLVGLLLHPVLRPQLRLGHVVGLSLGLLPIAVYLASNRIFFHTWLPISGMAKQLRTTHLPSLPAWHSFYLGPVTHPLSFLPVLFALALLPVLYRRLSSTEQVLYPVILLWPLLYILVLSCVSDWQLWMWYFYPFRPALCIAFVLFCRWQPALRLFRRPATALALALIATTKLFTAHWTEGDMRPMFDIATSVRRFAATHPGVYAMGDRSGIVAYLLLNPLVQTEGLVMDRPFYEALRRGSHLRDALTPYHVRFYIATQTPPYLPCFQVSEPSQAGPASPHLTQDLCGSPVALFTQGDTRTAIYDLENP